jgi:RNA polymerase sigma-70 factor (ECF subfamily)
MTDSADDAPLWLEGLRRGDPDALTALFSRHRDRLRRMIEFRIDARLKSRVSASDVLQEAYIEALHRLKKNPPDANLPFFVWVRGLTIQRIIDLYRRHLGAQARDAGREVRLEADGSVEASAEKMAALLGDLTSPSQAAERAEVAARVRSVLERLDPVDREVVALRHFEELSNNETAAVLGLQPPAASKRYVRAMDRLREALERLPGFEGGPP